MKYVIKNRFDGTVQSTADIDCEETDGVEIKRRLAVLWAIKNNVSLTWAKAILRALGGNNENTYEN